MFFQIEKWRASISTSSLVSQLPFQSCLQPPPQLLSFQHNTKRESSQNLPSSWQTGSDLSSHAQGLLLLLYQQQIEPPVSSRRNPTRRKKRLLLYHGLSPHLESPPTLTCAPARRPTQEPRSLSLPFASLETLRLCITSLREIRWRKWLRW